MIDKRQITICNLYNYLMYPIIQESLDYDILKTFEPIQANTKIALYLFEIISSSFLQSNISSDIFSNILQNGDSFILPFEIVYEIYGHRIVVKSIGGLRIYLWIKTMALKCS